MRFASFRFAFIGTTGQINNEFDRQNEDGVWGMGRYQVRLSFPPPLYTPTRSHTHLEHRSSSAERKGEGRGGKGEGRGQEIERAPSGKRADPFRVLFGCFHRVRFRQWCIFFLCGYVSPPYPHFLKTSSFVRVGTKRTEETDRCGLRHDTDI